MPKKSYGEHDRGSLKNLAARAQSCIGRLESLQEAMKDSGFDQLTIEGQAELIRGMTGLEAFVENGHKALRKAQEERGDFQAGNAEPKKEGNYRQRILDGPGKK